LNWEVNERFSADLSANYTGSMYVPHLALNPISDQEWELIDRDQIDKTAVARQNEINAIINEHVIQGERVEFSEPFLIFGARISYDFDFQGQSTLQVYTGVQNILYQTQQNHDRGVFRDAGYIYGPILPRMLSVGARIGNLQKREASLQ
jgi:outer membrane receptor for ferrienterochelin and colicins